MKKFLIISSMLSMIICSFYVIPVNAQTNDNYEYTCPTDKTINPKDIIGVEVVDGEVYVDVLYEINTSKSTSRALGKCPAATKIIAQTITRSQLIKMRDDLQSNKDVLGVIGAIVGVTHPVIGSLIGFLMPRDDLLNKVNYALAHSTKSSFSMKTTYICESVDMGQRGWVHRYRLSNFIIS